ncbi:Hsp20/alpha crystallin family protein [Candidatus Saccharibacteria bacterium]|nr:Hsp20/alpha crystallin family protein [Candidatus Saccharibacteria bacterium]
MNGLTRFDPFAEMRALQKQFFGEEWDSWATPLKSVQLATTDVYTHDDKELIVETHLPNFSKKDVDIQIDNGALVISGEHHEKNEGKNKKYVMRESSSSFYRRIRLPERADSKTIKADLKNGILKITVALKEIPKPQRIEIHEGK